MEDTNVASETPISYTSDGIKMCKTSDGKEVVCDYLTQYEEALKAQKRYSFITAPLLSENGFLQKNKFIIFGALAVISAVMAYRRRKILTKWQHITW
jgi:hypothetical protein